MVSPFVGASLCFAGIVISGDILSSLISSLLVPFGVVADIGVIGAFDRFRALRRVPISKLMLFCRFLASSFIGVIVSLVLLLFSASSLSAFRFLCFVFGVLWIFCIRFCGCFVFGVLVFSFQCLVGA